MHAIGRKASFSAAGYWALDSKMVFGARVEGRGREALLARAFGLRGGMDLAYGSDGAAVYVTMGSAWR